MIRTLDEFSWGRMMDAVDAVRDRVKRTAKILEHSDIPHAVIGGHAVAAWVARADRAAVRNTQDVDVLIRRQDLPRMIEAMQAAGFLYRHANHVDFFTEPADPRFRHGVHLIFSGEKVKSADLLPSADVVKSEPGPEFQVLSLEALVRMELTSFRPKDQVHLDDLLRVGLIDSSWRLRFPTILADRFAQVVAAFEPDPDNL